MHKNSLEPMQERKRVEQHINAALLSARSNEHALSRTARLTRTLLLGELSAYAAEGIFPQATDATNGLPTFVDANGTPCAMGLALLLAGKHDLVDEIQNTRNGAFVADLMSDARFASLLEAMGISPQEAAAIQPSYCSSTFADDVCGGTFSSIPEGRARSVLEVRIVDAARAEILAIYGAAPGLAVGAQIQVDAPSSNVGDVGLSIELERDPVVTDAGNTPRNFFKLESNGLSTLSASERAAHPLSAKQIAEARLSANCVATLAAKDSYWDDKPECSGGCVMAGTPQELSVLFAVAGAVLMRIRRRRNS
jgi:hypothetical protein